LRGIGRVDGPQFRLYCTIEEQGFNRSITALMPPNPDLVRDSKLDTQFFLNPEYTQHIHYISEISLGRRKVRKEERWKRKRMLGHGSFGEFWLEQCVKGDNKDKVRAVKRISKIDHDSYHRELEAITFFSHSKVSIVIISSSW